MKKRIISILTALALCLSLCPVFAEEPDPALCTHHPQHTQDCGFSPEEGQPCGFDCALCAIQELISALPENPEEDPDLLEEISRRVGELTEEQREQLDLSRVYGAAPDGGLLSTGETYDTMPLAGGVEYVDAGGNPSSAECTTITTDMTNAEQPGGWYAAVGSVELSGVLTFSDEAHLILTSGCSLTASIYAAGDLTIYGQSGGSGTLTARPYVAVGESSTAYSLNSDRTITINGGTIKATGNVNAAIGGIYKQAGTVVINGGRVNASTSGTKACGAAIGGGAGGNGNVTINGGTVNAFSDHTEGVSDANNSSGSAIGGGYAFESSAIMGHGTVTINGGSVHATNKSTSMPTIGGRSSTVRINGGITAARNNENGGAFGGSPSFSNAITFSNGEGTVHGTVELNEDIQIGNRTDLFTLRIPYGARLSGSGKMSDSSVGSEQNFTTENLSEDMIQVPDNLDTLMTEEEIAAKLSIKHPTICGLTCTVTGWSSPVVAKKNGTDATYTATYTLNGSTTITKEFVVLSAEKVKYLDETGTEREVEAFVLSGSETDRDEYLKEGGWYVLKDGAARHVLAAANDTRLILEDGCSFSGALFVPDGANCSVYGQSGGTGKWSLPFITGFTTENGANRLIQNSIYCMGGLTVHGGALSCEGVAIFGSITVNGGGVTVTKNELLKCVYNNGTLTVNGGTFQASGPFEGSGKYLTSILTESTGMNPGALAADGTDQTAAVREQAVPNLSYSGQPFELTGWTLSTVKMVENDPSKYELTYTKDGSAETVTLTLALPQEAGVQTVNYLDADGAVKQQECTVLTSLSGKLSSGWYLLKGNITGDIATPGDGKTTVNLILADGCCVRGEVMVRDYMGLMPDQLNIYAQSTGGEMGVIEPSDSMSQISATGVLTINGGRIKSGGLMVGTKSVTINGGILDYSTLNGTLTRKRGIVFENGAGTVYGNVTLSGTHAIPGGYSLNIPEGASLSGCTLTGGGTYTTENITEDMIAVDTSGLRPSGEDLSEAIKDKASLSLGVECCEQTFLPKAEGWTASVTRVSDEQYTVTFSKGEKSVSKTVTLVSCEHAVYGEDGKCKECGELAAARVTAGGTKTYYRDIKSAWDDAQSKTAAELYLMQSGEVKTLLLNSGDVTLNMAEGAVLTGQIYVYGGKLTLAGGTVYGTYGECIKAMGGTLCVTGGTAGKLSAEKTADVRLSGGGFRSGVTANGCTVGSLLAEGYAFHKIDGTWVTDGSASSINSSVTVEPVPLHITTQPEDTSQRYGEWEALEVGADAETAQYQWYEVTGSGESAVSGEVATVFMPSEKQRLAAGTYQYFCQVSLDGFTVRSNTVTFTVTPLEVEPVLGGTVSKAYDGRVTVPDGHGLTLRLEPFYEGDDVTVTADSFAYEDANAGENKNVTASGVKISGGKDAGNYTLAKDTAAAAVGTIIRDASAEAPQPGEGYTLDYDGEVIQVQAGYEVSTANDGSGTAVSSGGSISEYLGRLLYIRKVADQNHDASGWTAVALTARPDVPEEVKKTDEGLKGQGNGSVSGLSALMEYRRDGGNWTQCTGGALEGLPAGTAVQVRLKATTQAPHGAEASFTIAEGAAITLTFDTQGGSAIDPVPGQAYGAGVVRPADPTRENCTFQGWYKDAAGTEVWNFDTDTLTEAAVTIYAKWLKVKFSVSGKVEDHDGNPVQNAVVRLMQGSTKLDEGISDASGGFSFSKSIPAGAYNVVTTSGDQTKTTLVNITDGDAVVNVKLPPEGVSSQLTVSGDDTPAVVVGGLDEEAEALKTGDVSTVTVSMAVEGKSEAQVDPATATAIKVEASNGGGAEPVVEYLDITVTKNVDGTDAPISETSTVFTIVVPFQFSGKENIVVLRFHNGTAEKLRAATDDSKADGTYKIDQTNGFIYIYTKKFSTYAVAYEASTYTITFDANGGSVTPASGTTGAGGTLSSLPTPTRSGYEFTGWYTAASGGTEVTASTVFAADGTIYAHWQEISQGGGNEGGGNEGDGDEGGNEGGDTTTVNVTGVSLNKTSLTLTAGETERLTATVQPSNASDKTVAWTSSNPSVATVDSNGTITARAPGTAVITVTTRSGSFTASCTVTVAEAEAKSYPVTYAANGGSGSMAGGSFVSGAAVTLPPCGFTPPKGKVFDGWSYDGKVYPAGAAFTMPGHTVTFTAQWKSAGYTLGGKVLQNGQTVSGVVVRLMEGTKEIARRTTGSDGRFTFEKVPSGVYSLIAEKGGVTRTVTQEITASNAEVTITLPIGKTDSTVEIKGDTPPVSAEGLDDLFQNETLYTAEDKEVVAAGGSVEFKMTVEKQAAPPEASAIEAIKTAGQTLGLFLDLSVNKTVTRVDGTKTTGTVSDAGALLKIRVPLPAELQGKHGYAVYRVHGGKAEALPGSGSGERWTVNGDKTEITIYARKFSTYAIAWSAGTPSEPDRPVTPSRPSGGSGSSGSSGGSSGGWRASTYAVSVEKTEHGKVTSDKNYASANSPVTLTVTANSGYTLDTLRVTDSRGDEVKLTSQNGGKYMFSMPSRAVTVRASFVALTDNGLAVCDGGAACPSRGFADLGGAGTWYHEAVDYVLRNGLMNGYGNGLFGPGNPLTRAQFVQILYNHAGRPSGSGGGFRDVPAGMWCADAVGWAVSQGIVSGYSASVFGPDELITREQLAVMLWRHAGRPAAANRELGFSDAEQAGGYALDALRWAAERGIVNGYAGGELRPKGLATRAQTAQMLKNYMGNS